MSGSEPSGALVGLGAGFRARTFSDHPAQGRVLAQVRAWPICRSMVFHEWELALPSVGDGPHSGLWSLTDAIVCPVRNDWSETTRPMALKPEASSQSPPLSVHISRMCIDALGSGRRQAKMSGA